MHVDLHKWKCALCKSTNTHHTRMRIRTYNTDNTGSTAFTCGHTFANNNRCQYFNAYKSNVTQYIYCECMGMEVRKNHCIDLVWTATWGVCQSLRCLECSQRSHILAGDDGGDHDRVDDYIRWQLLGCLECTPKNYIAANMYQVSQKAYSSHILTCWCPRGFRGVGEPDYIMNVKYWTKSFLIFIQNLIPFN